MSIAITHDQQDPFTSAVHGLDFALFDADQHFYEAEDAVTRHLPRAHRNAFRWVDIDGRRTVLIDGHLLKVVPNPTYDPVGRPGAMETYFRAQNHAGRSLKELVGELQPIQPEYRDRSARLASLDSQGVEFTWLLPSLGLSLEEPLSARPAALNAVVESWNRWVDEDWGFDRDGRMQAAALLSFVDPDAAEAELARVLDAGARLIVLRPAPVRAPSGSRSLGDPVHDRLWARMAEAGVVAAFHAADSGYGHYATEWGEGADFEGWKTTPFPEVLSVHIERPIYDTMAALVSHGVFDRHPRLKVASLELGAGWVPELVRRLRTAYGKMPTWFGRDPVEALREHLWVAPFYEDDLGSVVEAMGGTEHLLLGSDWPHPEGVASPADWATDLAPLGAAAMRQVMRDNLRGLVGR